MKRSTIFFLVMCAAGALLLQYWQIVRGDLDLLGQANPAAACREARLHFRVLAGAGLCGMLSMSAYLGFLGRRMRRQSRLKGGLTLLFALACLAGAGGFAWLASGIDAFIECETLPSSPVKDVVTVDL